MLLLREEITAAYKKRKIHGWGLTTISVVHRFFPDNPASRFMKNFSSGMMRSWLAYAGSQFKADGLHIGIYVLDDFFAPFRGKTLR